MFAQWAVETWVLVRDRDNGRFPELAAKLKAEVVRTALMLVSPGRTDLSSICRVGPEAAPPEAIKAEVLTAETTDKYTSPLISVGESLIGEVSDAVDLLGAAEERERGTEWYESRANERIPFGLQSYLTSLWGVFDVPISRFASAIGRSTPGEAILDLAIALESLFGDSDAEATSYKVRLRAAAFLEPPGERRAYIYRILKRTYQRRSRIVHGGSVFARDDELVAETTLVVRNALVKMLGDNRDGRLLIGAELDQRLFGI